MALDSQSNNDTTFLFYMQYPDWVRKKINITEIVEFWFGFINYYGCIDKKSIFNAIIERVSQNLMIIFVQKLLHL